MMDARDTDRPDGATTAGRDGDPLLDPLTGEVLSRHDAATLQRVHSRWEQHALELLSACREVRRVLGEENTTKPSTADTKFGAA